MRRSWIIVVLGLLAQACSQDASPGNPAAPSLPGESQQSMLSVSCGLELNGYPCTAKLLSAARSDDVTGLSTWSVSDPSLARVNTLGFVTPLGTGEISVRAAYRDYEAWTALHVEPGQLQRQYRTISGFVKDARDNSIIPGVVVTILDGPNANRTATTGSDGAFQMYDLVVGTFTVRFTKSGYRTLDRLKTITGTAYDGDVSVTLSPF